MPALRKAATECDPKVIADQQGHTVDVSVNVYMQTPIEGKREAVETLASAVVN